MKKKSARIVFALSLSTPSRDEWLNSTDSVCMHSRYRHMAKIHVKGSVRVAYNYIAIRTNSTNIFDVHRITRTACVCWLIWHKLFDRSLAFILLRFWQLNATSEHVNIHPHECIPFANRFQKLIKLIIADRCIPQKNHFDDTWFKERIIFYWIHSYK